MDAPVRFETHPDRYRHLRLDFPEEHAGEVARIVLDVREDEPLRPGYALKLNSYDLGVDIEIADAVQRVRFEHPRVRALVVTSGKDRVFSAGANIYMLGASSHPFKVGFCKFTNETRLYLEQISRDSGVGTLCALGGTASGGGYELAMACDEIVLRDDGSSAVSLPETPLLGVLPGTGGLTRLVDKRGVRRDLADVFATLAEGVRGRRAVEWGLVDEAPASSAFDATVRHRLEAMRRRSPRRAEGPGVALPPLEADRGPDGARYRFVDLAVAPDRRVAEIVVRGPDAPQPETVKDLHAAGAEAWALRAFRELDDALLDLRTNRLEAGVVVVRTRGDLGAVLGADRAIARLAASDWLAREIVLQMRRVLWRLELSSRSVFALVDRGSCFGGSLLEVALAADRVYAQDDADGAVRVATSPLNGGALPTLSGASRLGLRFPRDPERAARLCANETPLGARAALEAGIATFAPDEIDWDDEVRVAVEERASLSPDALTGMEANLRFAGPETMETKVFGRLSAWQNWIFQRPNATGTRGALSVYGRPERPDFDWRRA